MTGTAQAQTPHQSLQGVRGRLLAIPRYPTVAPHRQACCGSLHVDFSIAGCTNHNHRARGPRHLGDAPTQCRPYEPSPLTEEERKEIEEVTRRAPLPIVLDMALHVHLVRPLGAAAIAVGGYSLMIQYLGDLSGDSLTL